MIDEIHVENLALIEDAHVEPSAGLTVFTGETGAGKTALLTSCKLLMGARAERTLVREGSAEAVVSGRFFLDGTDIVVHRRVSADGRSRVQINGAMASVGELADDIAGAIDLCSQHDSQDLVRPQTHQRMLDAWAADGEVRASYEDAFEMWRAAKEHLEDVRAHAASSAEQIEHARFIVSQIEAVNPSQEDYDELAGDLKRAEHIETLARVSQGAWDALSADEGALDSASNALSSLEEGARYDEAFENISASVREAIYAMEDASRELSSYRERVEFEPDDLVRMQDRMAAYQGLIHSWGPSLADVMARLDEARSVIGAVDDSERVEQEAQRALDEAERTLEEAASALHDARAKAAPAFSSAITSIMQTLEMGSAEVICTVQKLDRERWTHTGPDAIEMLFKPAQNMQPRPLSRIASGGELSRVLLALHVVLEDEDEVSTLVFDEIDAGVGGSTAVALADVLCTLAKTHQVMVVTHLAQVAARADKHYLVKKTEQNGVAQTHLEALDGAERVNEIARMLSGSATEASLAHARELLQEKV